jgi:hypothetical protein
MRLIDYQMGVCLTCNTDKNYNHEKNQQVKQKNVLIFNDQFPHRSGTSSMVDGQR